MRVVYCLVDRYMHFYSVWKVNCSLDWYHFPALSSCLPFPRGRWEDVVTIMKGCKALLEFNVLKMWTSHIFSDFISFYVTQMDQLHLQTVHNKQITRGQFKLEKGSFGVEVFGGLFLA